ncbi:MAG TPA: hypothetical protein VGO27_00365, partial [Candidatus Acidoferrum sp.]|nr:hypothetical protein [Candidatus Acidoferrum sp.]
QKRASGNLPGLINDAWWVAGYPKPKTLAFIGGRKRKSMSKNKKKLPEPQFPAVAFPENSLIF